MTLSKQELCDMRTGGKLLSETLLLLCEKAQPGVTPKELDTLARKHVASQHARPAFLNFGGYPASVCISRGSQIVHGIPNDLPFEEGELVSFDFGVLYKGLYTDAARTICIGSCNDPIKKRLMAVVEEAFRRGVSVLRDGVHVGDIGHAVQTYVEQQGFGVVRSLVGHAVGTELHGEPKIPNFGSRGNGPQLRAGMAVAIEPMITEGEYHVTTEDDGWTIATLDGRLSAHYENTVYITKNGYEIISE